jgi:ribosome-associated translation inhibitor RaiA
LEARIRQKVAKLERFCDHIIGCRVALERPQRHQRSGNPYRVRIDVTVPPGHEIVVSCDPHKSEMHDDLAVVVNRAFKAAARQLKALVARQRGEVKAHSVVGNSERLEIGTEVRLAETEGDRAQGWEESGRAVHP